MNILWYILIAIFFLLLGLFIGRKTIRYDGLFLVDESNNEKTRWILDVKIDPNSIPSKNKIYLKVKKIDQNISE